MIVTTTNSIEGREISRYNDPIAANVVIGTNIFGDRSTSYKKKMQEMYKRFTATLKQRAQAIRADAIIGLSVGSQETIFSILIILTHIPYESINLSFIFQKYYQL